MSDSTGLAAESGAPLNNWAHVQQSIAKILTTPIGSRVMRRDFGSELYDLIDAKISQENVLRLYAATALALDRWEPRFRLTHAGIEDANANGLIRVVLRGTYYPHGHLGDYSIAEDAVVRVIFERP